MISRQRPSRDDFARIHHHDPVGDGFEKLDAMLDDETAIFISFDSMRRIWSISSISELIRPAAGSSISSSLRLAHQQAGQQQLAPLERVEAAVGGS